MLNFVKWRAAIIILAAVATYLEWLNIGFFSMIQPAAHQTIHSKLNSLQLHCALWLSVLVVEINPSHRCWVLSAVCRDTPQSDVTNTQLGLHSVSRCLLSACPRRSMCTFMCSCGQMINGAWLLIFSGYSPIRRGFLGRLQLKLTNHLIDRHNGSIT